MKLEERDRPFFFVLVVFAVLAAAWLIGALLQSPIRLTFGGDMGTFADWWMFLVASLLLVVGIAQLWMFHRQLESMREGLRHTGDAAEAARRAVEASRNTERAYLFVEWSVSTSDPGRFELVVKNYGKTPATVLLMSAIGDKLNTTQWSGTRPGGSPPRALAVVSPNGMSVIDSVRETSGESKAVGSFRIHVGYADIFGSMFASGFELYCHPEKPNRTVYFLGERSVKTEAQLWAALDTWRSDYYSDLALDLAMAHDYEKLEELNKLRDRWGSRH